MAALVIGLAIATSLWGERIGINGGQGWDGESYVLWTANFKKQMFELGTTAYHAQRVLPSALLHYAMRIVGVTRTVPHILSAFVVFDTAMLVIAAVIWSHLGHVMRWRAASVWAGFVGMFVTFGLARHALYYPALTDTAAFALGMTVTWGYLAPRTIGSGVTLWLCVGVAMFTWPGLVPIAVLALLVPRLGSPSAFDPAAAEGAEGDRSPRATGESARAESSPRATGESARAESSPRARRDGAVADASPRSRRDSELEPSPQWRRLILVASAFLALALTAGFLLAARHYLAHPVQELGIAKFATWVRRDWLPITVPLLGAFLAVSWFGVLHHPRLWNVRALWRAARRALVEDRRWRALAVSLVGIAAWWIARSLWIHAVATKGPGPSTAQFICLQTLEALRGPAWGPVHHVVYFGPLVALGIIHARAVARVIGTWGHTAVAAFAMLIVFFAASESRQWIHLLPIFAAAVIAATDDRWTRNRVVIFTAVALVWSKLWLHIGYTTPGDWRVFPIQRYFMHLGPWASDTAWAWHGLAAIVTAAGMWLLLRSSTGAHRAASPAPPDLASAPR